MIYYTQPFGSIGAQVFSGVSLLLDSPERKTEKKKVQPSPPTWRIGGVGCFFFATGNRQPSRQARPSGAERTPKRRARNGAAAGADGEKPAQASEESAEDGNGKHRAGAKSGDAERAHQRELNITPLYYIARSKNFFGGKSPPRRNTAEKNFAECL